MRVTGRPNVDMMASMLYYATDEGRGAWTKTTHCLNGLFKSPADGLLTDRLHALFLAADRDDSFETSCDAFIESFVAAVHDGDQQKTKTLLELFARKDLVNAPDEPALRVRMVVRAFSEISNVRERCSEVTIACLQGLESAFAVDYRNREILRAAIARFDENNYRGTEGYDNACRYLIAKAGAVAMVEADPYRRWNNAKTLEILVDALSDRQLCDYVDKWDEKNLAQSSWSTQTSMAVFAAALATRMGPGNRMAKTIYDAMIRGVAERDRLEGAGAAKVVEAAAAMNDLNNPVVNTMVVKAMESAALDPEDLRRYLDVGLPTENAAGVPLLANARAEHVAVLAARIADKPAFLEQHNASVFNPERFNTNKARAMVEAGFPLGQRYGGQYVHEFAHVDSKEGEMFTLMHALGQYPPTMRLRGFGPLHVMAVNGREDDSVLDQLLARGYDIDATVGGENCNGYLSPSGWRRDKYDHLGHTPLAVALREGNIGVAKCLIERGADVSVKTNTGASLAQLCSKMDDVKRLLKAAKAGEAIRKEVAVEVPAGVAVAPRKSSVVL